MKAAGDLKFRHLPTNGGGPALTAFLGNNAQVLVSSISASIDQIKAGKARAAGDVRRQARGVGAGRADHEGARLRPRILSLGRHVRAEGHAGSRSSTKLRQVLNQAAHSDLFKTAITNIGAGARLSGPARVREVLGRGRRAHRSRRARDRPGAGVARQMLVIPDAEAGIQIQERQSVDLPGSGLRRAPE